jgi:hypothetical protein
MEDGNDVEIGEGTYTASGTTLSRDTVTESKIGGTAGTSKINLSGNATVFITARAEDIGDVFGPASATDNAIARYHETTGKIIQDSGVIIDDSDNITGVNSIVFNDTDGSELSQLEGQLHYDSNEVVPTFDSSFSGVRLQIGVEQWILVANTTGVTIPNGTPVYISTSLAFGLPLVEPAQANAAGTSLCIGLATHDILHNGAGIATTKGIVHDVDTSSFSLGDALYVSAASPGVLTATPPTNANFRVRVGIVTLVHATLGSIEVDIHAPTRARLFDIGELTPTDGNIIVGDGSTWVAENGATARTSLGLAIGSDVQAFDADTLKADTPDTLTAGFAHTPDNDGTQSSGTYTPDQDGGNMKTIVNGGAFTLAPPVDDCCIILKITNNGSAGAITTSGFTGVFGDAFTTTDADKFMCTIVKLDGDSTLTVQDIS